MDKKLFAIVFLLIAILFSKTVLAQNAVGNITAENAEASQTQVEAKKLDKNAEILAAYLAKQNSPLQYHAQDFIDAAKTYNLDWKLVPSIAGVESTFGKFIPGGFNGWGWGVYGTQAIYFNSWTEAIFTISKGLRENYFDKGLTDPYLINKIYAESPNWGYKVTYFMADLEKFASEFENNRNNELPKLLDQKIAAVSASLVIR